VAGHVGADQRRVGAAALGELAVAVALAGHRALGCVDCYARFARARYSYQSHTLRALRAVAHLTNALQVKTLCNAEVLLSTSSSAD
jgi:hypothetical protein